MRYTFRELDQGETTTHEGPEMPRDEHGILVIPEGVEKAAEEWIRGGDYSGAFEDEGAETIWVDVEIMIDDPENPDGWWVLECLPIRIDPPEPECPEGAEHDWQNPVEIVGGIKENPGVWGHGGGVTISECCMRCGCKRVTDTWAQRRDTGEQGLESVRYWPGEYAEALTEYLAGREEAGKP